MYNDLLSLALAWLFSIFLQSLNYNAFEGEWVHTYTKMYTLWCKHAWYINSPVKRVDSSVYARVYLCTQKFHKSLFHEIVYGNILFPTTSWCCPGAKGNMRCPRCEHVTYVYIERIVRVSAIRQQYLKADHHAFRLNMDFLGIYTYIHTYRYIIFHQYGAQ